MQAWSILGAGAEVGVRRGQLILRTLSPIPAAYRGFQLHPDDKQEAVHFTRGIGPLSKYGLNTAQGRLQPRPFRGDDGSHLDGVLMSAEKQPRREHGRGTGG